MQQGSVNPAPSSVRSERINLRLTPAAKAQIARAASLGGQTVSSFIVSSAVRSAERAVDRHARLTLTGEDAKVFFRALENPPPLRDRLRAEFEEHDQRVISR